MAWLPNGDRNLMIALYIVSRFGRIPASDGWTDGQTDGHLATIVRYT